MSSEDTSKQYLKSDYPLGRGCASSLRLNFQHHLLQKLLGYNIHPDITSHGNLPPNPMIADVGTGTAQWLIDVHNEIPSARLDGFDISTDQFPTKCWLPRQISLHELDITKDIPIWLVEKYDLVHVQLFLLTAHKDGPTAILEQLVKMLKPGGYLQWVEYDPTSWKVATPDPSLKKTANEKHIEIIRGPGGTTTLWPSALPSRFHTAGLIHITKTAYPLPPEMYAPFMQAHLCAAEEISFTALGNDGPEAEGPRLRKLLAECYEEGRSGVTMGESPVVVVGRKPEKHISFSAR